MFPVLRALKQECSANFALTEFYEVSFLSSVAPELSRSYRAPLQPQTMIRPLLRPA
jgi:hypothetical protein